MEAVKTLRILGKRGRVTVPQEVRDEIGLERGDVVSFAVMDEDSVLVKRERLCDNCVTETNQTDMMKLLVQAMHFAKPGESAQDATGEGVFNGTGPTTFDLEGGMTWGMFVTVLANKTEGYMESQYQTTSFTDMPIGQWYGPPVEWAAQNKLVGGVGNGRFAPNAKVTREQIVKILYDYAQRTGNDTSADVYCLQRFGDASSISSWARQAMTWAATHGIIKGDGGKLNPQDTATRAQVAQIFYNCRNF